MFPLSKNIFMLVMLHFLPSPRRKKCKKLPISADVSEKIPTAIDEDTDEVSGKIPTETPLRPFSTAVSLLSQFTTLREKS